MDEDDNLGAEDDVKNMIIELETQPDLNDEMQDMLHDPLTQNTKKELYADVQVGGLDQSLESMRKAMACGKKKTAENVHRAQNRVTGPKSQKPWAHWKNDTEVGKRHHTLEGHRPQSIKKPDGSRFSWSSCSMKHETAGVI